MRGILVRAITWPMIFLIRFYQVVVSPILPASCRFTPTCSEYFAKALAIWGPWRGFRLGLRRILRCHPFSKGGYDPVPEDEEGRQL